MKKDFYRASTILIVFLTHVAGTLGCSIETSDSSKKNKHSFAPFAGYTPTYRFFLGGGYFFESEYTDIDVETVITFVDAYQLVLEATQRMSEFNRIEGTLSYKRGFEPFYGLGTQTVRDDRLDLIIDQFEGGVSYEHDLDSRVTVGTELEIRYRSERGTKRNPNTRVFPNENRMAFSVFESIDYRDREKSPRKGWYHAARLRISPDFMALHGNGTSFAQLEIAFSFYFQFMKELILATHLQGAASFENPTYMYQYSLGGSDKLRGYHRNRFRGNHYYVEQTEVRFPIVGAVFGALFADFGATDDEDLSNPKLAYGGGIRVGIPPDYVEKARIDFGFGHDQFGVFVDFAHAF